jgi:hypothetical protein
MSGKVQRMAVVAAVASALLAITGAQEGQAPQTAFLVTVWEAETDLSPGGLTVHDCIVVRPDGRFHLERRKQKLPNPTATLDVLESSLDVAEFQQLRNILDSQEIRRLPRYVQPAIPMAAPWFQGFNAKITRGGEVQSVGYWSWRGGTPAESPNSTPDAVKKEWRTSQAALRPLVDWVHAVEGSKLVSSPARSTLCSDGDSLDAK